MELKSSSRKMLRAMLFVIPILVTGVCCWILSRPPDIHQVSDQLTDLQMRFDDLYATHVPEVEAHRVADGIFSVYDQDLEIGLFAMDFVAHLDLESSITEFEGLVYNADSDPVKDIAVTIWLLDDEGSIVDLIEMNISKSMLQPHETVIVKGVHVPSEHPRRLLEETIQFFNESWTFSNYYYGEVVTESRLVRLASLADWIKHVAVYTKPGRPWSQFSVDLRGETTNPAR